METEVSSSTSLLIGVDIGGNNSDSVLIDNSQSDAVLAKSDKSLSYTTADVNTGIKNSITSLIARAQSLNIKITENLKAIAIGTTDFINAVIQKGDGQEELKRVSAIRLCGSTTLDFPPFGTIENEQLLSRIQGPSFFVDGGMTADGKQFAPLQEKQLQHVAESIIQNNIHNIAVCGIYATFYCQQEVECRNILQKFFSESSYPVSITCSHEISNRDGILERENATIINECLKGLAQKAYEAYTDVVQQLNLNVPLLISKNDGGFLNKEELLQYPVLTFSASVVNSLKGAQWIYKESNAIVVDIGGTSTDVAVIYNGAPRMTPKVYVESKIPLNFRKPLTNSIALGGGSIVSVGRSSSQYGGEITVNILPDSISFELTTRGVCFGGNILNNADFALWNGYIEIEKAQKGKLKEYFIVEKGFSEQEFLQIVQENNNQLTQKIANEILTLITPTQVEEFKKNQKKVSVLLVRGGAKLFQEEQLQAKLNQWCSVSKFKSDNEVANAIRAVKCLLTNSIDKLFVDLNESQIEEQIQQLIKQQAQELEASGAIPPIEILDMVKASLPYAKDQEQTRVQIASGAQFNWNNLTALLSLKSNNNKQFDQISVAANKIFQESIGTYNFKVKNLVENVVTRDLRILERIKRITENLQPVLVLRSEEEFEWLAQGVAVLGSGGGGSVEQTLLLLKRMYRSNGKKELKLYNPLDLVGNQLLVGIAQFGSPSVTQEYLINCSMLESGLLAFIKNFGGDNFVGISNLELGGSNGLINLVTGYSLDIPMFDCTSTSRAYPKFGMQLPHIEGDSCLPINITDLKGNHYEITTDGQIYCEGQIYSWKHETKEDIKIEKIEDPHQSLSIETVIRNFVTYHMQNECAISASPCTRKDLDLKWFLGGYRKAYEIGRILHEDVIRNHTPAALVIERDLIKCQEGMQTKVLIEGKIVDVVRKLKNSFDFGYIIVKQNTNPNRRVKVWFQNEFLLAWEQIYDDQEVMQQKRTIVTTPDLITVMDSIDCRVISQEQVSYGLNVIVVALKVEKQYMTKQALERVGPQVFKKDTEYVQFYSV